MTRLHVKGSPMLTKKGYWVMKNYPMTGVIIETANEHPYFGVSVVLTKPTERSVRKMVEGEEAIMGKFPFFRSVLLDTVAPSRWSDYSDLGPWVVRANCVGRPGIVFRDLSELGTWDDVQVGVPIRLYTTYKYRPDRGALGANLVLNQIQFMGNRGEFAC